MAESDKRSPTSGQTEPEVLEPKALRRVLGNFVTGVTIVTTIDGQGRPRGMTVNSFTSVSLDPPLVLVCIDNRAASCDAFRHCNGFTINILHSGQRDDSAVFATKDAEKFDKVEWELGATGAPRISDSLASIDCANHEQFEAGDHAVIIGRVVGYICTPATPLVFGQGAYIPIDSTYEIATATRSRSIIAACIVESDGRIVVTRKGGSQSNELTLPAIDVDKTGGSQTESIRQHMGALGLDVELSFLYSMFDSPDENRLYIVYRGFLTAVIRESEEYELYDESEIPWDRIERRYRGMLKRFFWEREIDQFGIYTGEDSDGTVVRLGENPYDWDDYTSDLNARRSNGK